VNNSALVATGKAALSWPVIVFFGGLASATPQGHFFASWHYSYHPHSNGKY
jgi:hypothetical protein